MKELDLFFGVWRRIKFLREKQKQLNISFKLCKPSIGARLRHWRSSVIEFRQHLLKSREQAILFEPRIAFSGKVATEAGWWISARTKGCVSSITVMLGFEEKIRSSITPRWLWTQLYCFRPSKPANCAKVCESPTNVIYLLGLQVLAESSTMLQKSEQTSEGMLGGMYTQPSSNFELKLRSSWTNKHSKLAGAVVIV